MVKTFKTYLFNGIISLQIRILYATGTAEFNCSMECEEMEDKTFELMTKMYAEMIARFDSAEGRFDSVEKKLDEKADKTDIV